MPRRLLLRSLLSLCLAVGLLAASWAPLAAQAAEASTTVLSGAPAAAGDPVTLTVAVSSVGAPVAGAAVSVERRVSGRWTPLAQALTDAAGQALVPATQSTEAGDNAFRAAYAGDATRAPSASGEVTTPLVRRASTVRLTGSDSVVEGRRTTLTATWQSAGAGPVAGPLVLSRRVGNGWQQVAEVRSGADGRVDVEVDPLDDTRYRLTAAALDWVAGARSKVLRVAVLPSGTPVRLPRASPRPRITLPPQPHAVGDGANPVVVPVPDGVWASMVGRSWHRGCPVGRAGLRWVRVNYWDYDGFRRRGELVVATGAAAQIVGAVSAMYDARLPIRSMYRVDRFGWSPRLRGADDYRSMAAGNTSAFNCRDVVNRSGVRSPHSSGRSLDVNPWENPYRSATGLVPNSWWQARSHPRVAWRSRSHPVVRVMARNGLRWSYGLGDTQHFDA